MVANGFSGLWYPLIVLVPKSPVKKFPEFFCVAISWPSKRSEIRDPLPCPDDERNRLRRAGRTDRMPGPSAAAKPT